MKKGILTNNILVRPFTAVKELLLKNPVIVIIKLVYGKVKIISVVQNSMFMEALPIPKKTHPVVGSPDYFSISCIP